MKPLSLTVTLAVLAAVVAIGALAAGAVALVPVLKANTAASSSPSNAGKYCDSFLGHLGTNLGKSSDDVKNAINQAIDQTLADAVKNGDLTQDQANNLKSQINKNGGGCQALESLRNGVGKARGAGGLAALSFGIDAAAKALGISTTELKQDLASGKTLHQVADSKHVSEDQFKASVKASLKDRLDTAVKNGKTTQKQEDDMLNRVDQVVNTVWDKALPQHTPRAKKASPSPAAQ